MIRLHPRLDLPAVGYAAACACVEVERPPGTSEQLRARARSLSRTAQAVRDAMARLRAIADDHSTWTGEAAESFHAAVREPAKSHINKVPERYDGYARQLISYAGALDDAQMRYDTALARVQAAVSSYRSADASGHHAPHVTDCAEQECLAAARQFQTTYNEWVDAANRCIRGLKDIDTHDKLHNPHGIHAAVDGVSQLMNELGSLSAVLALVSLALCPELAIVFFAISTAATGVKLVADTGRELLNGEHVGWRTFAFDALGSIPVAGPAKGAAAAAKEARAAKGLAGVANRVGSGAKAFGKQLGREYHAALHSEPGEALRELAEDGRRLAPPSWARTSATMTDASKQDLLGYPASYADDAWDNRRHGWAQALGWSAFRVTWAPVGEVVPSGASDAARNSLTPLGNLPRVLHRLGVQ